MSPTIINPKSCYAELFIDADNKFASVEVNHHVPTITVWGKATTGMYCLEPDPANSLSISMNNGVLIVMHANNPNPLFKAFRVAVSWME